MAIVTLAMPSQASAFSGFSRKDFSNESFASCQLYRTEVKGMPNVTLVRHLVQRNRMFYRMCSELSWLSHSICHRTKHVAPNDTTTIIIIHQLVQSRNTTLPNKSMWYSSSTYTVRVPSNGTSNVINRILLSHGIEYTRMYCRIKDCSTPSNLKSEEILRDISIRIESVQNTRPI